jgi:hypothetical protein
MREGAEPAAVLSVSRIKCTVPAKSFRFTHTTMPSMASRRSFARSLYPSPNQVGANYSAARYAASIGASILRIDSSSSSFGKSVILGKIGQQWSLRKNRRSYCFSVGAARPMRSASGWDARRRESKAWRTVSITFMRLAPEDESG